jgi:hypothetical protein
MFFEIGLFIGCPTEVLSGFTWSFLANTRTLKYATQHSPNPYTFIIRDYHRIFRYCTTSELLNKEE